MCGRRAVYQQLFSTCQGYTRFSSILSVHSASQHLTSCGSGSTSSQTVLARCPGATLRCEISSEVSDEISREISDENLVRNFQAKFPNGHFGLQNKVFGKSAWKIRRYLRIPLPQTQLPLPEPTLSWVELVEQWCGALAHSIWLGCCESHGQSGTLSHEWFQDVSPIDSSHVASTAHLHTRTSSVVVCVGQGPVC